MSNYNYNYRGPSPGPGPNTPGPNRGSNNNGGDNIDTISWIVDIGMIFLWLPVGLFLTIAKSMGHDFVGSIIRSIRNSSRKNSGNVRGNMGFDVGQNRTTSSRVYGTPGGQTTSSRVYSAPSQQAQGENAPGWTPKAQDAKAEKAAEKDDGIQHIDKGAKVLEIVGWIIGAFGLIATIGAVGSGLWSVLSMLAIVVGGGAMVFSGRRGKRKEAAFKRCMTVSGTTGIVKLDDLAQTLGMTEEELEKQIEEMIDRGYYGARAYIDHARGLLVIEPEQMRDVYKAEDEAKAAGASAAANAAARASMTEYQKILEQIRTANDEIADENMTKKIHIMEELTAAIFTEVQTHPAKKPQIQRFMNYYLPTTLKLLDSYARIEQQGVSGDNMAKAKADIERIADTLVEGYRKQLDTLYQAEAVDIAGDVSVIENMMRRDGLTGQNDFRIRTEPAQAEAPAQEDAPAEAPAQEPEGQVLGGH
jgi:hypothetical protein